MNWVQCEGMSMFGTTHPHTADGLPKPKACKEVPHPCAMEAMAILMTACLSVMCDHRLHSCMGSLPDCHFAQVQRCLCKGKGAGMSNLCLLSGFAFSIQTPRTRARITSTRLRRSIGNAVASWT